MYNFLLNQYFKYFKKSGWFGDYPNWKSAAQDCKGYADDAIFEKVVNASQLVRDGAATFERDGVAFSHQEIDEDLIKILQKVPPPSIGLKILDFGGALGSSFFQHRHVFENFGIKIEKWVVVEQAHFVEIGKREFETDILKFEYDLTTALQNFQPQIVLFNSVLQYLENPMSFFDITAKENVDWIFISRTPSFDYLNIKRNRNVQKSRITQQIISPKIYAASYPSWVFGGDFWEQLIQNYTIQSQKNARYGRYLVGNEPLFLKDVLLKRK